jgi:hypothetical protein
MGAAALKINPNLKLGNEDGLMGRPTLMGRADGKAALEGKG